MQLNASNVLVRFAYHSDLPARVDVCRFGWRLFFRALSAIALGLWLGSPAGWLIAFLFLLLFGFGLLVGYRPALQFPLVFNSSFARTTPFHYTLVPIKRWPTIHGVRALPIYPLVIAWVGYLLLQIPAEIQRIWLQWHVAFAPLSEQVVWAGIAGALILAPLALCLLVYGPALKRCFLSDCLPVVRAWWDGVKNRYCPIVEIVQN